MASSVFGSRDTDPSTDPPSRSATGWSTGQGRDTQDLRDLLRCAGCGDEVAFAALYDAICARLYGVALRVLGDTARAEEATRETFLEAWRTANRFDESGPNVASWLLRIVHRMAVERVRSALPTTNPGSAAAGRSLVPRHVARMVEPKTVGRHHSASNALARLNSRQRAALILAYYAGHTHTEVDVLLGFEPGVAQACIREGLIRLRDLNVGL